MEVSYKWLQDFLPLTVTPEELAEKLTMAGVPAEEISKPGAGITLVFVPSMWERQRNYLLLPELQICMRAPWCLWRCTGLCSQVASR